MPAGRLASGVVAVLLLGSAYAATAGGPRRAAPAARTADTFTLSLVATTDLHGAVFERRGRGGLAWFGGYVKNLRAARAADGGGVLLVDAGDTYQGGIESNLSEGGIVVDAYNALGYAAAAVGNHEFDFGPVDRNGRRTSPGADPRGALKALAGRARFPLLAANLVDEATGRPVSWPNVRPSALVHAGGVTVGLVGVMTIDALSKTLAANTRGLRTTPLAPAIVAEAAKLRAAGAGVIVVAAHAGGSCRRFDQPDDLSSCDEASEIFRVARALPAGLVDVIVAGHAHAGIAHRVNGIAITASFSHGRAFGRVDLTIDRQRGRAVGAVVHAPQAICARVHPTTGGCEPADADAGWGPARYEGRPVAADPAIADAMGPALREVRALQATPLGVHADTALRRNAGAGESPLGALFADAIRAAVPGADAAIVNASARGGLRADLPPGPLTFGLLYDVFPFDNQVVGVAMTGAQLASALERWYERRDSGVLGLSGIRAGARCEGGVSRMQVRRTSGEPIGPAERLVIATTEMIANGRLLADIGPTGGIDVPASAPVAREVVAAWFVRHGGRLAEPARPESASAAAACP